DCHTPHASSRAHLLLRAPPALCASCHDPRGEKLRAKHARVPAGAACGECHEPHGLAPAAVKR
ncbi:MAG TPA: cytochrome c3 family protein, partial [Anaeromyxobacter sp.]